MALYHTYRPQTFADTTGQSHIKQTIQNQLIAGKIAHAYLFSGPRGVGKTTTARLIAKAVNCLTRKETENEPCNTCDACTEITNGRAIDVIEIDAASHTGVDNVRENIIENAQFKPTTLKKKVFIIDEVHMLSTSAFNALLKTLEEPPAHVIFVLATTELHKLPDTIISRCQRFGFKKIAHHELKERLLFIAKNESVEIDDDVLNRIINKSDGCVRDAISLLDQVMATGEKKITADTVTVVLPVSRVEDALAFTEALCNRQAAPALKTIEAIMADGVRPKQFLHDTLELLRIIMILRAGGETNSLGIDLSSSAMETLNTLSTQTDGKALVALIDACMKRQAQMHLSPLPALPLELLVVEWCTDSKTTQPPTPPAEPPAAPPTPPSPVEKPEKMPEPPPAAAPSPTVVEEPAPIAEAQEEPVEATPPIAGEALTHPQAQTIWKKAIDLVEQHSPSLVFILKMATIEKVDGNAITIGLQYGFHQDRIEDSKCKPQIEKALSDTAGQPIRLITTLIKGENAPTDRPAASSEVQELAAAFGGEVVQ